MSDFGTDFGTDFGAIGVVVFPVRSGKQLEIIFKANACVATSNVN
jgi:hypothetical protein